MKFESRRVVLRKGGMITSNRKPLHLAENKEQPFMRSNMIIGKLMRPVLETTNSQNTPSIIGGDIMDFSKVVNRNARNLQKKKDEGNIKFIY